MFYMARNGVKRARSASMEVSVLLVGKRTGRPCRRHKTTDNISIKETMTEYQRQQSAPSELLHVEEDQKPETSKAKAEPKFEIRGDLIKEFNPTTKFDRNDAMISGVTFSPVGDLCVADSANGKIKLFDANGSLKVECTVPKRKGSNLRPHGLALMSKGNIIASDKTDQNLKIFTPFGRLYSTVELECGNLGKLCTFENDKIAVIDEDNRNIIVVTDTTKQTTSTLCKDQSGQALFKVPYDVISVKIDDETFLLLSDIREKKLVIVDPNKKESKNCEIQVEEPYGLAKVHTGAVLVADKAANTVIQLSGPSLTDCETLLGPEHGLDAPVMLTASSRGYLAVVENDRTCIKLFR